MGTVRGVVLLPPATATIGVVSTMIAGARYARGSVAVTNMSINNVFLAGGAPAVLNSGIYVAPNGGIVKLEDFGITTQAVYAIAAGAGSVLAIQPGDAEQLAKTTDRYVISNLTVLRAMDVLEVTPTEFLRVLGTLATDLINGTALTYMVINLVKLRTLNATDDSVTEGARVLGTLITDLVAVAVEDYTTQNGSGRLTLDPSADSGSDGLHFLATLIEHLISVGRLS